MKKAKYLLAVLAGVIVYVLLCSTCGRNGIWAANQLLEQKRSISANTQAIENINEELVNNAKLFKIDNGKVIETKEGMRDINEQ